MDSNAISPRSTMNPMGATLIANPWPGLQDYRSLQKKGVTIRKPVDCMIASVAVEHDIRLLRNDRDLDHIAEHSKLKIYG